MDLIDDITVVLDTYPVSHLLQVVRPPVGPYVIRNELIRTATENWILFHDSDDMACDDRLQSLAFTAETDHLDLVGSHSLHLDETATLLLAVRYPLAVNVALERAAWHPQLHPTTLLKKSALALTGYFSTDSRYGNDVQFLLRASFFLRIGNIDRFLYIRRVHRTALTQRPDTGLSSSTRQARRARWVKDFWSVRRGDLSLDQSSLGFRSGDIGSDPYYNGSVVQ